MIPSDPAFFKSLADNSPLFIGMCDMNYIPFYVNDAGRNLVGLEDFDHFAQTKVKDFFFPDDQHFIMNEFFPRVLKEGRAETEIRFRHFRTGEAIWMTYDVFFLSDESGKAVGLATVSRDITERKRAEEALREAGRRKDEFLAVLAHELRNPLAPIRSGLEILRTGADGAHAARLREIMARQVDHLVRLVDDLLEVSRISRGLIELRRERVDLIQLVRDAVAASQPLIARFGHRLAVSAPSEPLPLDADPTRLAQVLTNLLDNATKFTHAGGQIEISARREKNEAVLSVQDNGAGISADKLKCVFELFMQLDTSRDRSTSGLGIGLALARSLVEMHGGLIEARSEGLGRGSELIVRLPLAEAVAAAAVEEALDEAAAPARRVLVVDDQRDVADMLAMLLETLNADVRVAYDGPTALEIVPEFKPDVVFLDIGMPRMDGYETARRLRQLPDGRNVLLVALSGWGREEDRHRALQTGFDEHLVKPVKLNALQALVTRSQSPA
jgi:PAS domain S-box-containing protein